MPTIALPDLAQSAGADLGASSWIRVEQDRIDVFAEATEDRQWIHVDAARAAKGPFGTTIAHGYLTLSLVSSFVLEVLTVTGASAVVNYGLDRVRFPSPVAAGFRLRGHVRLAEVTEIVGGWQTLTEVSVECEGSPKPACVAQVLTRFMT